MLDEGSERNEEGKPEDFTVRIRPHLEDGAWDGSVSVDLLWSSENPLSTEDFSQVMYMTQMVCSSVAVMDNDPFIAEKLEEYVNTKYNNQGNNYVVEDNIIKVDFTQNREYKNDGKR